MNNSTMKHNSVISIARAQPFTNHPVHSSPVDISAKIHLLRGKYGPRRGKKEINPWPQQSSKSPLPLKPRRGPQNRHGLIHHPFPHAKVLIDPFLEVFVLGDLVGFKAGAVKHPTRPAMGRGREASLVLIFLYFFPFW